MDWLTPIQAVVLLLLGALASYWTQQRIESIKAEKAELSSERDRLHEAKMRLRDERRKIYLRVLDPYIEVFHGMGRGLPVLEANQRLSSVDHRKAAFELKLVGTDEVVMSFNALGRYIIDSQQAGYDEPGVLLRYWAELLHSIRRSVGEPGTALTPAEYDHRLGRRYRDRLSRNPASCGSNRAPAA